MAFYIREPDIFDKVFNYDGIDLIKNKITSYGNNVKIEVRHEGTSDEVTLIQTIYEINFSQTSNYSNIVMLHPYHQSITINPISNSSGDSVSLELSDYIKQIPSLLRDLKIEEILKDEN